MTGISNKSKLRIAQIEEEFGEPFADVVKGFAADGHGLTATAHILDYAHTLFKRHLEILGIEVKFCAPRDSIGVKEFNEDRRARPATKAEIEQRRYASSCIKRATFTHEGITATLREHCERTGIAYITAWKRSKKSTDVDYIFSKAHHNQHMHKARKDHPWRTLMI